MESTRPARWVARVLCPRQLMRLIRCRKLSGSCNFQLMYPRTAYAARTRGDRQSLGVAIYAQLHTAPLRALSGILRYRWPLSSGSGRRPPSKFT
jgi:hypothetical protein